MRRLAILVALVALGVGATTARATDFSQFDVVKVVVQPPRVAGYSVYVDMIVHVRMRDGKVWTMSPSYRLDGDFAKSVRGDFGRLAEPVLSKAAGVLDAAKGSDEAAVKAGVEAALPRVRDAVHYALLPGVTLDIAVEASFSLVADAFATKTGKTLTVTSGTRTPAAQARAMYDKLAGGDDLSVYRDKAAVAEIRKAYEDGIAAVASQDAVVAAMAKVIDAQVQRGTYISLHLKAHGVDIRSKDLSPEEKATFKRLAEAQPGVVVIEESIPPHLHVQFP